MVGGAAVTEEIAPGFRSSLAHAIGPMREAVVRDMQLARRVEFVRPDPRLIALSPDGRALAFSTDVARTAEAIRAVLGDRRRTLRAISAPRSSGSGAFLRRHARDDARRRSIGVRRRRAVGSAEDRHAASARWAHRRIPAAALDADGGRGSRRRVVLDSDLLMAAIAARGIFGAAQGPWSAGTGALLLLNAAADPAPGGSSVMVKGGAGALTAAMADAAREAGAEIRTGRRRSRGSWCATAASPASCSRMGPISSPTSVIANTDPNARCCTSSIRSISIPGSSPRSATTGCPESSPSSTSRSARCRRSAPSPQAGRPARTAAHRPEHRLPRTRLRCLEVRRDLEPSRISTWPFHRCSIPSLAPPGRHVMSVYMQFAPYPARQRPHLDAMRDTLATTVLRTLERYAPGISRWSKGSACSRRKISKASTA